MTTITIDNLWQGHRRNWLPVLAGMFLSVAALMLLLSHAGLRELTTHLRQADRRFILAMTVLYVGIIALRALRWQHLLCVSMPLSRAWHLMNISYLVNAVLPLRAGEVARIALMSREPRQSAAAGLSALTLERLLDMVLALLCVGIGLIWLPDSAVLPARTSSTLGAILIMTLVGIVTVLSVKRLHAQIIALLRLILRPLPVGVAQSVIHFATEVLVGLQLLDSPRRLGQSLLWSALLWLSYTAYYQIALYAFVPGTPAIGMGLLVVGFIALGAGVPSLPGAVGIFQAAAVLALTLNHYDTGLAASYAWGVWVPQTLLIIVTGTLSLWATGLSLQHVTPTTQIGSEQPGGLSIVSPVES